MDLDWITPRLAVGGRPTQSFQDLAVRHGVGAVVDLRAEGCDDVAAVRQAGMAFLHLPTDDHQPPSRADLDAGVAFILDRWADGATVLVHCEHGIGRSAILALCALCAEGVAPLEALRRAKDAREKVSPSSGQYEGWKAWLATRGLDAPDLHTFGCIAYRQPATA